MSVSVIYNSGLAGAEGSACMPKILAFSVKESNIMLGNVLAFVCSLAHSVCVCVCVCVCMCVCV